MHHIHRLQNSLWIISTDWVKMLIVCLYSNKVDMGASKRDEAYDNLSCL